MSEYAPAFFENGFDSIKLLSTIEKEDLPGLVPKKGHHRLIQQALDDLRRKHSTVASGRSRPARRKHDRQSARRRHDPFDEDSDDSFVVDDSDEYSPGVITAMFRKGRKRSYSLDSADSRDMEATFDEIQHEEERRWEPTHPSFADAFPICAFVLTFVLLYVPSANASASTKTTEKSCATRSCSRRSEQIAASAALDARHE